MPESSPIGYFARGPQYTVFTDRETGDVAQIDFEDFNVRVKMGDQAIVFSPDNAERFALYLLRFSIGARSPEYEATHREFFNRAERRLQATESDDECIGEHGEGDADWEDDLDEPPVFDEDEVDY